MSTKSIQTELQPSSKQASEVCKDDVETTETSIFDSLKSQAITTEDIPVLEEQQIQEEAEEKPQSQPDSHIPNDTNSSIVREEDKTSPTEADQPFLNTEHSNLEPENLPKIENKSDLSILIMKNEVAEKIVSNWVEKSGLSQLLNGDKIIGLY